jgi:hypothetical protein
MKQVAKLEFSFKLQVPISKRALFIMMTVVGFVLELAKR